MYCSECGTQNNNDVKKCTKCGTSLKKVNWFCRILAFVNLVVLLLIVLFIVIQLPCTISMQDRANESYVKANMYYVKLCAELFASKSNGIYPRSLDQQSSITKEVFSDIIYPSNINGSIGFKLQNPFHPYYDSSPVIVSNIDPPQWNAVERGRVVFVPLGSEKNGVKNYKIYGKGKTGPLRLILYPEDKEPTTDYEVK